VIDKYNKLVRDKIPEIIRGRGDTPVVEILDDERYFGALNEKLTEEVAEYLENHSIEELADILEVIHAIAKCKGLAMDDIEQIRRDKHSERGGFGGRVSLVEVKRKMFEV